METESSEQSFSHSMSALNKSKFDKAQARRLKMPKRNRSAYFLFSMDARAKLKAEFGNNLTPLEMQAKVSQYWKELSLEEKEKFEAKAKDEKLEYLAAMEKFYSNLTPETLAKSKTTRPKKPCSAYAHFVRDIKTDLKKENPRLIMQEILHIVSDKWRNLDEATRAVYEEKARQDKEQYMLALKNQASEDQGSPSVSSQDSEELGKRPIKIVEPKEKSSAKKVKLDSHSQGLRQAGEPTYKLVHMESQEFSNPGDSPSTKGDSENGQEALGKLKINLSLDLLHIPAMEPVSHSEIHIPALREDIVERPVNMCQSSRFGDYEKMKEMAMAKLSWERLVQTNKSLEQAIGRRVAEVKAMQAYQQLMLMQKLFLASNASSF